MLLPNCPVCQESSNLIVDSVSTTDDIKTIKYHCNVDDYRGVKKLENKPAKELVV